MRYYTDEDLQRDLEDLGLRNRKPSKTDGRKYNITVGKTSYLCTFYEVISLNVPALDHKPSLGKRMSGAWNKPGEYNTLSFLFDVAFPDDIFESKSIEVLALQRDNDDVILVAKLQDRDNITESLSCSTERKTKYSEACSNFSNEINAELRRLGFGSNYSFVYADAFQKIIAQFDSQKKEQLRNEESFSKQIVSNFDIGNYLCAASLTNEEKLEEYRRIIDFCSRYLPELAEPKFRVETLYDKYHEFLNKEQFDIFYENWSRLCRSFNALSRGASGEEKVYEVLRLFDDRIRILKSYVSESMDYRSKRNEHDFVVITPYGISTIEVKNLRGNYVLTETGILKCLSSDKVQPKDVALQSKKHLETLRRNLNGCSAFSADVPLQEIICSAESNFTIRDNYHYIPVCYYNTVDKALFPEDAKPILNEKAMDAIEKYLLENRREAVKFDVFLPRGEIGSRADFIRCFANVASGVIAGKKVIG